jgi:hypothetical protein
MTQTRTGPARHAAVAVGPDAVGRSKNRLAMRLWTLLHAQALLRGPAGGAGDALTAEDDHWRLAARLESTHRR